MTPPRVSGALLVALLLGSAGAARADLSLKFGGHVSSDIRYRFAGNDVGGSPYPSQYRLLASGFSRNENRLRNYLNLSIGEKVKAVADVEFVYYGFSDVKDIDGATLRERVDPYFIEANAAYIDIYKVLPGLDLRIGRQVVHWGASDLFNPTSNINTLDLSDPILFGRALPNNMVRADWNPVGDLTLTGVFVPIFRPAQLPRTAPLALTQADRPAPVQEPQIIDALGTLATLMRPKRIDVTGLQPEPSLANAQYGARLAGKILGQDVSVSYYHGRFGIPSPAWTIQRADGTVEAGVVWPRMDVVGADAAGTIAKLGGMGYWLEGAVFFPQEITYGLYNDLGGAHTPVTFRLPDDKRRAASIVLGDPPGMKPTVVPSTPFFKLTIGADYSIGEHLYLNLQYLHGFIDEFGAGIASYAPVDKEVDVRLQQRIGDYLVGGADLKILSGTLLLRLFGVIKVPSLRSDWSLEEYHPTGVLYPLLAWQVWDATELDLGAFLFLGDRSTKFGDPAAGASEVFAKAKFTY